MIENNLPQLDLHGLDQITALILTRDFLEDNKILGNQKIVIVHGIGKGILKKAIHQELSKNKRVKKYYQTFFNIGMTIVEIQ